MRILMLAQFYRPLIGGEERYVRDLSIELVARGHDVSVATLWQEGMPAFECDSSVRVHRIRASMQRVNAAFSEKERQHSPPFPDPEVLWALRRTIRHERPDIVHAHNWMVHSFTPLKAWSKAKLVVTLHDCSLVCAKQAFVYRGEVCSGPGLTKCLGCAARHYGVARGVPITLANWFWGGVEYRTVNMFLPVSRAVADATQLARHRVPYCVIPNFVSDDLSESRDDAHPLLAQLPEDDYLLFVGDMGRGKGEEVLLRAYAAMESQIPLVLIGRMPDGFAIDLPPNVLALSSWPRPAVMSAWQRCTIALTPSTSFDSCPTVALEAMAMGRPVIASRIGGLPDIVVDGETGLLVDPGDELVLRQSMRHLLDDPVLRERMGVRAKQRVGEFQASTVVPRIEQVYQEVLQS
ncbi:MAG TPA: glycosyltransferase family 4 protein [Ktedonobacteraceae bacterium]|nr:glycosyltransferase family 4 protein [Ktedonobacteraceae bacterium]